jgi:hypothetical protein
MDDKKVILKATIEANKISRLSRELQNIQIKKLEKKFKEKNDRKTGIMLEVLRQKQEIADEVLENLVHGGELGE